MMGIVLAGGTGSRLDPLTRITNKHLLPVYDRPMVVYAIDALQRHGALAGSALTVGRIGRCHPWCAGGFDPVPAEPPRLFRALLAASPAAPSSRANGASDTACP